jgi:hypothetical protein
MSGILDLLNSDLGKQIINGVSQQTGQEEGKTGGVLTMALPVLMEAMKRNAATPEGAEGLKKAIEDKHDGSILDNLEGLFGGGVDDEVKQDGDKILGHILGDNKEQVEEVLGAKAGMDSSSVQDILKVAAPILMGVLGKKSQEGNANAGVSNDPSNDASGGLEGLLGGLLGGNSPEGEQGFLASILDANGDGNVIDDVAGMVLGKDGNKEGGIGDLLGGLFGKK